MFRFAQPEYLYLLLIVPLLVVLFVWNTIRRKRKLQAFGAPALLAQYMPNVSLVRPQFKFYIQIVALVLLIIALARPQFGVKEQTVKRQGMEVMIALDVSNSMLAQDVAPSRLERSKQLLSKIIDGMTEDKVGLVVFAGDAYTQLPITCDYVSAKMFLSSISPNLVARQGTAIGSAIDLSIKSFGTESSASRAIVLITDGENHEDDAIGAAKLAKEKGIQVFVLGVGKPEGSPIPLEGSMSFRKDKAGNVVVSKLNEEMCWQIAQAGGGMYLRVDNTNAAQRTLQKELGKLAKSELETRVYSEYNEQYQSFVILALILLVIEFFIFGRRNKRLSKINLYK